MFLGWTADQWQLAGAVAGSAAFVWNVLSFLGSAWPRLHLAPGDDEDRLHLVFTNAGARPLMIVSMWQFRRAEGFDIFPAKRDLNLTIEMAAYWIAARWMGDFRFYIPPSQIGELRATARKKGSGALLVFWWHRFWFLPIKLPTFVWVSAARAELLHRGNLA